MHNMENAAADDMASAATPPKTAIKTTISKPKTKPPLERMTDLFCDNFAGGRPTTLEDLRREGFNDETIKRHQVKASLAARKRMNITHSEH